jgi:hypothetical protein
LNDSAYIDMARNFAYRMQNEAGNEINQQVKKGYELATYHAIDDKSLDVLLELYNTALVKFKNNDEKTCKMVGIMSNRTNAETAALIVVANAMLNLDEVIMKN